MGPGITGVRGRPGVENVSMDGPLRRRSWYSGQVGLRKSTLMNHLLGL